MSKVSEKKAACGYQDKPVNRVCANCASFSSDRKLPDWMKESNKRRQNAMGSPYTLEKYGIESNIACGLHGFAVKKMGACGSWSAIATKESK